MPREKIPMVPRPNPVGDPRKKRMRKAKIAGAVALGVASMAYAHHVEHSQKKTAKRNHDAIDKEMTDRYNGIATGATKPIWTKKEMADSYAKYVNDTGTKWQRKAEYHHGEEFFDAVSDV